MRQPTALLLAAVLALAPVPVAASGLEAIVAARTIHRGELIGPDALRAVAVRSLPAPGFVMRRAEAEGRVARRTIARGRLVPLAALRAADHVEKGARVQLLYRRGGLRIAVPAIALGGGRIGGTIPLRVPLTGLRTSAMLVDGGTAVMGDGGTAR